jgi:hypothetical protein
MTHRRDKNETWLTLFQELALAASDYERHLNAIEPPKVDQYWSDKKGLLSDLRDQVLTKDPSIKALAAMASKDPAQAKQLAYEKKDVLLTFFQGNEKKINDLKKRRGHRRESNFWQVIDHILDKLGLLHRVVHGATLSNKLHLFSKKIKTQQYADLEKLKEKAAVISSADELVQLLKEVPTWPERRLVVVAAIFDVVKPKLTQLARHGVHPDGFPSAAQNFGRILSALTLTIDDLNHFGDDPAVQKAFREIVQSPKHFSDLIAQVERDKGSQEEYKQVILQLLMNSIPGWLDVVLLNPESSPSGFMQVMKLVPLHKHTVILNAMKTQLWALTEKSGLKDGEREGGRAYQLGKMLYFLTEEDMESAAAQYAISQMQTIGDIRDLLMGIGKEKRALIQKPLLDCINHQRAWRGLVQAISSVDDFEVMMQIASPAERMGILEECKSKLSKIVEAQYQAKQVKEEGTLSTRNHYFACLLNALTPKEIDWLNNHSDPEVQKSLHALSGSQRFSGQPDRSVNFHEERMHAIDCMSYPLQSNKWIPTFLALKQCLFQVSPNLNAEECIEICKILRSHNESFKNATWEEWKEALPIRRFFPDTEEAAVRQALFPDLAPRLS